MSSSPETSEDSWEKDLFFPGLLALSCFCLVLLIKFVLGANMKTAAGQPTKGWTGMSARTRDRYPSGPYGDFDYARYKTFIVIGLTCVSLIPFAIGVSNCTGSRREIYMVGAILALTSVALSYVLYQFTKTVFKYALRNAILSCFLTLCLIGLIGAAGLSERRLENYSFGYVVLSAAVLYLPCLVAMLVIDEKTAVDADEGYRYSFQSDKMDLRRRRRNLDD